jgi:hypothetical protein
MSELTDFLHRLVDRLGLHPDTLAQTHADIDGSLLTADEKKASEPVNPYAEASDQAVIDAAVGGDGDAQAEYRRRKDAAAAKADAATTPPATEA